MTDVADRARLLTAPEISLVHTEPEARAVVGVLSRIWGSAEGVPPLPAELAWVLAHTGNYVAVARCGGEPVAAAVALRARDAQGDYLHSHIAGVDPRFQGSNIGFLLKQHQREWALASGFDRITWTFDPLVARNAYFNVMKLGAELTDYFVDFYGAMDDGVNRGDETDRCLATWLLRSERAVSAAARPAVLVDPVQLLAAGAEVALAATEGGEPERRVVSADVRLLRVPADIVAVRRRDPAQALAWRLALRSVLVPAFADGMRIVAVTRDPCYVLARSRTCLDAAASQPRLDA